MKKSVITLACIAFSTIPLFAQLYYPTTGSGSGAVPPSGIANTFFGNYTGNLTSTGHRNSFFGHYTGAFNTSGEQNTFVGCLSGYNNSTGSYNAFYGERSGSGNTSGGANTYSGYLCGLSNTTSSHNTFTGFQSGYNNTAAANSFYGSLSGYANTSGTSNSFYGYESGRANTTASFNSFYGNASGKANTTGYSNSFFGNESGEANTTGNSNSFYGSFSGLDNTTGSSNTFMGLASGQRNTTGSSNAFFGSGSGITNTTGLENSFFGDAAGFVNTTGQENVFIGNGAGASNVSGNENTYVGSRASYSALGIGNTSLGYRATPANNVNYSTAIGHFAYVSTDYTVGLGDASAPITVLIGKTAKTAAYSLETNGDIYVNSTFYPSDKQFKRNIETYTNALDLINKLQPVKYFFKDDVYFPQEKGDAGKPIKRNFDKEEQIGFIAQELEQVFPNMVRTDKNGFKAVNYAHFFGVLTQGIKEQDVKITSLEIQNKELSEKLDAVNALLSSQKANGNGADAAKADAANVKMNGFISSVSPNPFSSSTTINYVIPENYKQANLSVVSESGIQVANVSIRESGKGFFVFAGETLKPGSYYCYLTINGVIVDYQKIVLVK
ncbi:MAG: tail fiber domain-containing protein [Bacteroidota bacterium]